MFAKVINLKGGVVDDYEERRERLMDELEDLIWEDLDAFLQLDDFCLNARNRINNRARQVLISKGFLDKDGELPSLTNEAMYELRTGHKPFWLKDKTASI